MSVSTNPSSTKQRLAPADALEDKRAFYSLPSVSANYDRQRFGGASGRRVNQRELATVAGLLERAPVGAPLLDLACGTGRLACLLQRRSQRVIGLDWSRPMVEQARDRVGSPTAVLQGDAFALPFATGAFGGVAALRFAFHWPDLAPLLEEMRRVAMPGAPLVFDTYVWSPRALLAFGAARWGGRVFTHRPGAVRQLATRQGLTVEAEEHAFLCSPYVYRLLPLRAVRALERIERVVPSNWLCRVFWRLRGA